MQLDFPSPATSKWLPSPSLGADRALGQHWSTSDQPAPLPVLRKCTITLIFCFPMVYSEQRLIHNTFRNGKTFSHHWGWAVWVPQGGGRGAAMRCCIPRALLSQLFQKSSGKTLLSRTAPEHQVPKPHVEQTSIMREGKWRGEKGNLSHKCLILTERWSPSPQWAASTQNTALNSSFALQRHQT